ncbi:helix-turn-helix domain-containing protein [Gluconobacter kondonii]
MPRYHLGSSPAPSAPKPDRPPAKAVEQMRLEAARLMIEKTRHPMDQIARESGFVDIRRMREAFMRKYGQPPQTLRRLAKAY